MINQLVLGSGIGFGSLFGIHYLGRIWTRWEMNKIINNPNMPEDLRYQAEVLLDTYNLNKKEKYIEENLNSDLVLK
tara:strand:- start:5173 stop:5400 length:228 start_codon:yes stop_codon:yes gene_type:complete